jgi:serine/threonine protein kinase
MSTSASKANTMKYASVNLTLPYTLQNSTGIFYLLREIGAGSFAKVYRAVDHTGKNWAVKTFDKARLTDTQIQTIENEARIMRAVSGHANVAQIHCSMETSQHYFLVMELFEMDLFEAITKRGGFFDHDVVVLIMVQIIDSLKHIHSRGVYHRDIKPENVLIHSGNRIVLADFGLATTKRFTKDYGCGSVRYMSPECMNEEKTRDAYDSEPNDVWALGIILINLLFGKNPWHEARISDPIYARYMTQDADILMRQFNLSREASQLVDAIFQVDPADRISLTHIRTRILAVRSFTQRRPRRSRVSAAASTVRTDEYTRETNRASTPIKEKNRASTPLREKIRASTPLKINIERSQKRALSEYHTHGPDSAFESNSPMSPVQRVKSRIKRTLSRMFN